MENYIDPFILTIWSPLTLNMEKSHYTRIILQDGSVLPYHHVLGIPPPPRIL